MTSNADADEDRELTETGVKEVEDVVGLRRDDLSGVTRIYSSPLKRVKQTLYIANASWALPVLSKNRNT